MKPGSLILAALLSGVSLTALPGDAQARRVPCPEVLRQIDRVYGRPGTTLPDAEKVARRFGVDPVWVERCAQTYGRRLARPVPGDSAAKQERLDRLESEEFEELGREEREAQDEVYVQELDDPDHGRRRYMNWQEYEWAPETGHEWFPHTGYEWEPFLLDDDGASGD